jgi:hypothetical protein
MPTTLRRVDWRRWPDLVFGYHGSGGRGRPADSRLRRRRSRPDHDQSQQQFDSRRREPDRCGHQWRNPDFHDHVTVKRGAKPNLAAGSDPAVERFVHHRRPDDHETEADDHDDDIIDHHHDHNRPVGERSALVMQQEIR